MPEEESYEMTRSQSNASSSIDPATETVNDTEEAHLLTDKQSDSESDEEDLDEDEEWAIIVEENATATNENDNLRENLKLRFFCIALAIALFFLIFRLAMIRFSYDPNHKDRGEDKVYNNGTVDFATTVILISIDGFRPDYLERGVTPNLNQFAKEGVMAKEMHPSFPPSTFPNHWTLVTGLYPESHGIVANLFYDPTMNAVFSHSNFTSTVDKRWWNGEPIWKTSKKNKKRSGSIMWPGSDIGFDNPDYVVKFNGTMGTKEKMDITLGWIDLPFEERPQMISVYIPQIDQEGHRGGPNGSKMNTFLQEVDDALGYFLRQLMERNLLEHVNIVIVSDHGMSEIGESKLIFYDDILSKDVLQHIRKREALPLLDLRPEENAPNNTVEKIYKQLHDYTQKTAEPHFQVYLRQNVPDRFHYKHSNRITPVVAIPDVGYTFITHEEEGKFKKGGNHGYDNLAEEMSALFMARGPKIKREYKPGTILAPFFNTEVYGFLTELLNMDAATNNGTLEGAFPVIYQPPF